MHIEIDGVTEKLIQAGIASGRFRSAEDVIAEMARAWAASTAVSAAALPRLSPSTDIRALAAEQGIQPFDPHAAPPDFWPEDETCDEFLAFLHDVRHDVEPSRKQ